MDSWKEYIRKDLIPIIKSLNVKLEGNIYSSHLTFNENLEMKDKQSNFQYILKKCKPKNILEIGFNAGFSCLLMKMILPESSITCIDLNEHKYVMPCFNKLSSDFTNLKMIPGSSYDVGLPKLIKENLKFDLIHIDGDHRLEGAKKDLDLCIKLSHNQTIIIFDDTNIKYLDDLCTYYVKNNILKNYYFNEYLNKQAYKHRFLQLNSNKIPVYLSLTSIFKNQDSLLQTLVSLIKQTIKPDKIFLYLSEEAYILDSGFKDKRITNTNLLKFINENQIINIKWVKNIGSYRKLIPLLKEKWNEDCIIITIDDDTIYNNNLIKNLLEDYNMHKCVIGYRGFTPLADNIEKFDYAKRCNEIQPLVIKNFLTGVGGILYKPEFFYKTNNLIFDDNIFLNTCEKQDDVWFYILRILNNINCYMGNKMWLNKHISYNGLSTIFNSGDANTNACLNTIKKLKELKYIN